MTSLTRNYSPLLEPSIFASIYPYRLYNPAEITISTTRPTRHRDRLNPIALTANRLAAESTDIDVNLKTTIVTPLAPLSINPIYTPFPYSYPDLNSDNDVQKRFTLYFWYKLKRHWIKKYMKKLSKYIDSKNYNFILNGLYTKQSLAESLDKFRIRMNLNWWDLKLYKHTIKKFIYYQIKKKIKKYT